MRRSIVQTVKECYQCRRLCGPYVELSEHGLELHHIYGGPNRKASDKEGLTVWLCHRHHNEPPDGVHFNRDLMKHLHEEGQRAFEMTHTRDDFMNTFGKNWL